MRPLPFPGRLHLLYKPKGFVVPSANIVTVQRHEMAVANDTILQAELPGDDVLQHMSNFWQSDLL